jgi:hypothetical protein
VVAECATVPARPAGPIPVEVDHRVRVTLSSRVALGPLQGTVLSVSPDTLAVEREEGGVRRLTRSQVDGIQVSTSRERDPVRGAGLGLVAVAPWLVLATIATLLFPPDLRPDNTILIVAGGAAAAGAVLGAITHQDQWVEASWSGTAEPASTDSPDAESL